MVYVRKLQKIGKSLFVSLPAIWIDRVKLSKGNHVEIVEQADGTLSIYPEVNQDQIRKITLQIERSDTESSLRRKIMALYVDGYNVIKLTTNTTFSIEQHDVIKHIITSLFGLELIEIASDYILIQCILTDVLSIEKMIQRIQSITLSMLTDTRNNLQGNHSSSLYKQVAFRVADVKRLSLVILRILRRSMLLPTQSDLALPPIDIVDFLRILDRILGIAKNARDIAETLLTFTNPVPNNFRLPLLILWEKVSQAYDRSLNAFLFKNNLVANAVLDENLDQQFNDVMEILFQLNVQTINPNQQANLSNVIAVIRQVHIYSTEIAEIAIDRIE